MATNPQHFTQTKLLAQMAEAGPDDDQPGRCEWTDADGNLHCNNFTAFQCQQVGGDFTPGARCPEEA